MEYHQQKNLTHYAVYLKLMQYHTSVKSKLKLIIIAKKLLNTNQGP